MLLRQAGDWETSIAQRLMAKKKRKHSKAEIAAKLAQANDLATQGKLQSQIARTLGVSVMTLHRWRKMPSDQTTHTRIAELQLENSRLRRLVADLLLEKMKLEEG
jgi:putative transposase